MPKPADETLPRRDGFLAAALVVAALAFYVVSLAPGLLWGDSSKFQRMAWEGELRFDETGHPLWVVLIHPLARLPGIDPAWACNLSSAILSSLALWPAFAIARRLGATRAAAFIACAALAVSHTYWLHAVMAEVYALNSLVSLLVLLAAIEPLTSDVRAGWRSQAIAAAAGLAFGLASGNHPLVVLWIPGMAVLVMMAWRRGRLGARPAAVAVAGFLVGLAPLAVARLTMPHRESVVAVGARLIRQMLLPQAPLTDVAAMIGYLLYQFPTLIVLVAAVTGAFRLRRERPVCLAGLLALGGADLLFAFGYQARDRFVFYLPLYLVVALLAGPGLDRIASRAAASFRLRPAAVWGLAGLLCIAAPPLVYALAAGPAASGLRSLGPAVRTLPFRDGASYHLYPGKRGEDGPRRFCDAAFEQLPQGAVLLADHTLLSPMKYEQVVEGRRPDAQIYFLIRDDQAAHMVRRSQEGRPLFIAATDEYYDVPGLSRFFTITPAGPIFRLEPR